MIKFADSSVMELIVEQFPGFQAIWNEHLDYWEGEAAGLNNDMAELSTYAQNLLNVEPASNEVTQLFALAEDILTQGDEPSKDAIATSFLENTLNALSPNSPSARRFAEVLGPHSRAFCLEWDRFSGGQFEALLRQYT
jgi:hypothetical protein